MVQRAGRMQRSGGGEWRGAGGVGQACVGGRDRMLGDRGGGCAGGELVQAAAQCDEHV
jgi:hypothetical protein